MPNIRLMSALGLALAASLSFAVSPVGAWKGKVSVKAPALPPNVPAEQKAMVAKMLGQVAKATLALNLKKDGTYQMKANGFPGPKGNDVKTGKWSVKGSTVTLTESGPTGHPEAFALSANGKTMSMDLPGGQGKVTFTR